MIPPKVPLCLLPTPLHRLDRLSAELEIDLWIKRDDLTGFAMGGNKGRKLEYLLADALAQGAEVVVTCGAAQSNFVRQLGAACAVAGLRCVAAVMDTPYESNPPQTGHLEGDGGNVLLDEILGVELHRYPDGEWETLFEHAEWLVEAEKSAGRRVYPVPVGGSSALGAYAFYEAAREIPDEFDWIVTSSASGSTQVGLSYAFHGTRTKVFGICADPESEIHADFADLGYGLAELLDLPYRLNTGDFEIDFEFVGPGYGVSSEEGDAAIERMARTEGIFLDPIYTGKAFAALLSAAAYGTFVASKVLFWHTGGLPTLFAR